MAAVSSVTASSAAPGKVAARGRWSPGTGASPAMSSPAVRAEGTWTAEWKAGAEGLVCRGVVDTSASTCVLLVASIKRPDKVPERGLPLPEVVVIVVVVCHCVNVMYFGWSMEVPNQNHKKDIPTSYSRSSAQVTGGGQFRQPTMRRLVQANGKLRTQFNRHVLRSEE